MKKTQKHGFSALSRLLPQMLALLLLLPLLAACADTSAPADTTKEEATEAVLNPTVTVTLADGNSSDAYYTVIRPEKGNEAEIDGAKKIFYDLHERCPKIHFKFTDDWVKRDTVPDPEAYEILVGVTNRPETSAVTELALRHRDYAVCVLERKILIYAHDDDSLAAAVEFFLSHITTDGTTVTYTADRTTVVRAEYPMQDVTLCGRSAADYRIVLPSSAANGESRAAEEIFNVLCDLTGLELPIVTDAEPASDAEILIGQTNRAASGAAFSGADAPGKSDYLLITANGSVTLAANCEGSYLAAAKEFCTGIPGGKVESGLHIRRTASLVTYRGSDTYMAGKYGQALSSVLLTGDIRADIVAIAKSQVGYSEGDNASQLAGTVQGGSNYTEYGAWYGMQDMWCQMFASFCTALAGVPSSVYRYDSWTVRALQDQIDKGNAYTRAEVEAGKYTPIAGDIIYFRSSRNEAITNHVGIVTGYENGVIYTVEGNTHPQEAQSTNGGQVAAKKYNISDTYIVYVCSPDY